jgi:hypothetical protein
MIHTSSAKEAKVPYHVVMDVTPEMAFKWLEANTRNRPLSQAHIQRLACDMRNDRWLLTHQGIAFDIYGLLLDGQHRLWAVIEADKPVTMRVFFDEPCESRKVLDTGERRSNLDVLAISSDIGIVTNRHLATLRAMLAGLSSPSLRLTPGEEGEHFRRHRNAIAFSIAYAGAGGIRGVLSSQVRAVIARAYYTADEHQLAYFCDVLRSGISTDESDYTILALRNLLIDLRRSGNREAARRLRYAKTEWALDAFLRGQVPKRLRGTDIELFPLPEEIVEPVATTEG